MPHKRGMPTKPQASHSWIGVVALAPLLSKLMSIPSSHPDQVVDRLEVHVMPVVDRLDQEIGDKTDNKKPRHNVHRDVIGLGFRHATVDLVLPDVVDQNRTEHTRHRPSSDQKSVDRADIAGAEHVLEISRTGRETT